MPKRAIIIVFLGTMFLICLGYSTPSFAEVSIDIGIGIPAPPPPIVIHRPPPVVVIPKTYVYYPPDVEADIFFYHGYWYRPHHGHWYRSRGYDGQWVYIGPREVPGVLFGLPPDYRHHGHGGRYIAHDDLGRHWESWERERHWDNDRHGHEKARDQREGKHKHQKGKGEKKGRD